MALTDLDVKQKYTGNGATTTFAITFDFETTAQIVVTLTDVSGDETIQILGGGSDYTLTGGGPDNVEMNTPPAVGEFLTVYRDAGDINQPDVFISPVSAAALNARLDDMYRHLQELDEKAARAITGKISTAIPDFEFPEVDADFYIGWNTGGTALENKVAISGPTGAQGIQGVQGIQGIQGNNGSNGSQGSTGAQGVNGIFSVIASQGTAETGTNNTEGMTALRVKQAIEFYLDTLTAFVALVARVAANELGLSALSARVNAVEGSFQITHSNGEQRLLNNTANEDMAGTDSPDVGRGNRCELNPVGAKSAEVVIEVFRKDDGETRFSRHFLELHNVDGTWFVAEKSELVVTGSPSGLTFDITTDGSNVVLINYTSDNMVGGNYSLDSKIRWQIREIPATSV